MNNKLRGVKIAKLFNILPNHVNLLFEPVEQVRNRYNGKVNLYDKKNIEKFFSNNPDILLKYQNKKLKKDNLEEKSKIQASVDSVTNNWFTEKDTKYIIHIGPTNSGKTYHALQDLKQSKNGLYLCPLRLLAWEVYESLNGSGIPCNLLTGEERDWVGGQITASTVEMCDYSKRYDTVIIDEAFMFTDSQRGKGWTRAILEVDAKTVHIISNLEAKDRIVSLLTTLGREFEIKTCERLTPLEVSDETITMKNIPPKSILCCFSRIKCLMYKKIFQSRGKKVSVLYGNLPPQTKKEQMRLFIDGETDYIIATDVIGMGLNLPCDNVIFLEDVKFDGQRMRRLNNTEIKQIGGRAGRFMKSKKGTIYTMEKANIKNIRQGIEGPIIKSGKGILGMTEDILEQIPGDTINEKLKGWKQITFVPEELKDILREEPSTQYAELCTIVRKQLSTLNWKTAWKLLLLPVKKNNLDYWEEIVDNIAQGTFIKPPLIQLVEINSNMTLELAEDTIARMDLFYYTVNTKIFRQCFAVTDDELIKLREIYYNIIDGINAYLVNTKLQGLTKCQKCDSPIYFDKDAKFCNNCH